MSNPSHRPRTLRTALAVAVALVALATAGVVYSKPKPGQTLTVRVMSAKVMQGPRFIGAAAGSVSRGDQLVFKQAQGDWYQVEGAFTGWIHRTNVVEKDVKLASTPGAGGGSASREEVELAGRGFTPQVEGKYRRDNPNLDFSHVDAIEKIQADPESLAEFVRAGKLAGGAR